MKAVFFTEGGKNFGLGHLTRCIALAQAFTEKGIASEFIVNADTSVIGLMESLTTEYVNWTDGSLILSKYIAAGDIAVIDSYTAGCEIYRQIHSLAGVTIYFDDFNRLNHPPGFVINGALSAETIPYPAIDRVAYLLGPDYQPLRQPFWDSPEFTPRPSVQKIFLSCGGSDPHRLTSDLLEFFQQTYPGLKITAIIGNSFQEWDSIQRQAGVNTELLYSPSLDVLIDTMKSCDLAVIAAGQTVYELAALGIPPVVIGTAENQKHNITGWLKTSFIEFAGWWNDELLRDNLIQGTDKLITDFQLRLLKHDTGRKIMDGQGCRRIIQKVLANV
jgi:UDP-2,4-diacetamido-2,4,6-trideoxy-beta-L-altropyranose hydrolase